MVRLVGLWGFAAVWSMWLTVFFAERVRSALYLLSSALAARLRALLGDLLLRALAVLLLVAAPAVGLRVGALRPAGL